MDNDVRALREAKGLTQAQLGQELGVSRQSVKMPLGVTAPEPVSDVASNVVDFSVDEGVKSPVPKREICRVVDLVLAREGIERPCMVSVSVVTDERMAQLNHRWRGKDRATDVLSLECERPDDADLAPGEPCELGDVILAPAYVAAQAARFGTTPADEFLLLLVHGVLHLLGYDHLTDEEAGVMEAREDELLALIGAAAPTAHVTLTRHGEDGLP